MHFLPFGIVHGTNASIVLPFRRGVNRDPSRKELKPVPSKKPSFDNDNGLTLRFLPGRDKNHVQILFSQTVQASRTVRR